MRIWWELDLKDDDERYIYEERLGILEVTGKPTINQHEIAMETVRQFRLTRTTFIPDGIKQRNQ